MQFSSETGFLIYCVKYQNFKSIFAAARKNIFFFFLDGGSLVGGLIAAIYRLSMDDRARTYLCGTCDIPVTWDQRGFICEACNL